MTHGERTPTELVNAIRADQRRRWSEDGQAVLVETYLDQHPDLASDQMKVLELVYQEVLLREERGEQVRIADYLERFPQLTTLLPPLFEVHEALESDSQLEAPDHTKVLLNRPDVLSELKAEFPTIPDYEILEELGRGGMGIVYRARQLRLSRIVALKMLRDVQFSGAEVRLRFIAEAETVARIQHPNIVQIFDVGVCDGRPFFAMEFVSGGNLAAKLQALPQPIRESVELLETLARAIQAAHEKGIVHRDLKPANILLGDERSISDDDTCVAGPASAAIGTLRTACCPKITDFGLARRLEVADGLTPRGALLGTPSYMAPEQARGDVRAIAPVTDVYALGAVLYELLTGRPPFRADSTMEIIRLVLDQEPISPRRLRPAVPYDLETICLKCLQKDPGKRYARAAELADDLRRYLDGKPIRARAVSLPERAWRWSRRKPALASLAAALVLMAVFAIAGSTTLWLRSEGFRTEAEGRLAESRFDNALTICRQGEINRGLLVLADSLALAVKAGRKDLEFPIRANLSYWSTRHFRLKRRFDHSGAVTATALSPNREFALTGSEDGKAYIWHVGEDKPPAILDTQDGQPVQAAAFSPDNRFVLTAGRLTPARLWNRHDGMLVRTFATKAGSTSCVAFSRDGKWLLTAGSGLDSSKNGVQLWRTDSGEAGPLLRLESEVGFAEFTPDGRSVCTVSGRAVQFWDVPTGTAHSVVLNHPRTVTALAIAPDGRKILTAAADLSLRLWDRATGKHVQESLTGHGNESVHSAAFSENGQLILTSSRSLMRLKRLNENGRTYQPVDNLLRFAEPLSSTSLASDGKAILAASATGVQYWELPTEHCVQFPGCPAAALSPD